VSKQGVDMQEFDAPTFYDCGRTHFTDPQNLSISNLVMYVNVPPFKVEYTSK